ncbi:hypothetical protein B0H13DRAFT_2094880 [Mycena leptocephala]|nr:hypothetical protein B0H13DRAFT_2094880 [Mycena leptocephala]
MPRTPFSLCILRRPSTSPVSSGSRPQIDGLDSQVRLNLKLVKALNNPSSKTHNPLKHFKISFVSRTLGVKVMAFKLQASRSSLQVRIAYHFPFIAFACTLPSLQRKPCHRVCGRIGGMFAVTYCILVPLCSAFVHISYFSLLCVLSSILGKGKWRVQMWDGPQGLVRTHHPS